MNPYIFVLNNGGYTIEKLIHGIDAQYNNIQSWNHLQILPLFGATNYQAERITTVGETNELFGDRSFATNDKIRLIEVMFNPLDAPIALVKQAHFAAEVNKGK